MPLKVAHEGPRGQAPLQEKPSLPVSRPAERAEPPLLEADGNSAFGALS